MQQSATQTRTRERIQAGVIEICLGPPFAVFALLGAQVGSDPVFLLFRPVYIPLLGALITIPVLTLVQRWLEPRLSRAEASAKTPISFRRSLLRMTGWPLCMGAFAFGLPWAMTNFDVVGRAVGLLLQVPGVLIAAYFLWLGVRLRIRRFLALSLAVTLASVLMAVSAGTSEAHHTPFGPQWLVAASLVTLSGIAALVHFVRSRPVLPEGAAP